MYNENWPRWVFASISQYFYDNRQGIEFLVEGQVHNKTEFKDTMELRIDGPYATEISKDYWKLYSEVNVLLTSKMDLDLYRIHRNTGIVAAIFTPLQIFKYGTGPGDDQSLLGCMTLLQEYRNTIQISHFGQIEPNVELLQATVEGHYNLFLSV